MNNGFTETVQHHVFQALGHIMNAAQVLHSVPVQPPACVTVVAWRFQHHLFCARRGRAAWQTIVNSVEKEPHVEGLTQHLAGRLAVPGASAAAGVRVLMDSGSSITAMSEELVQALRGQPGRT